MTLFAPAISVASSARQRCGTCYLHEPIAMELGPAELLSRVELSMQLNSLSAFGSILVTHCDGTYMMAHPGNKNGDPNAPQCHWHHINY